MENRETVFKICANQRGSLKLTLLLQLLALILATVGSVTLSHSNLNLSGVIARHTHTEWSSKSLPFTSRENFPDSKISFNLETDYLSPTSLIVRADDCIESLSINGEKLVSNPVCIFPNYKKISLPKLEPKEKYKVKVQVTNKGGKVGLWIDKDPLSRRALIAPCFLLSLYIILAAILYRRSGTKSLVYQIFLAGAAIRSIYFYFTPFWLRSYDSEEHLDYINHIVRFSDLPGMNEGWQFFQAPLYYLAAAGVNWVGNIWNLPKLTSLGWFSLLLSLCTLATALTIAKVCTKNKLGLFLFSIPITLSPLLIYPSTRISNDSLVLYFVLLSILCVCLFLKTTNRYTSLLAIVFASLGVACKLSAIPSLVLGFVFLFFLSKNKLSFLLKSLVATSLILTPLVYRMVEDQNLKIIGTNTIKLLHPALKISKQEQSFSEFKLEKIWEEPFNNPWDEKSRRGIFWEYFFKSSLFGEFRDVVNQPIAKLFILLQCGLLLLSIPGLMRKIKHDKALTLYFLSLSIISVLAIAYLRLEYPYSPTQDARYAPWIVVSLGFFLSGLASNREDLGQIGTK